MAGYSKECRDYVDRYGNDNCDYLNHRITMSNYHRGAVNALIELERM